MEYSHVLILFGLFIIAKRVNSADWTYSGDHGPSHWADDTPACGGDRQSPIKIVPADTEEDIDLGTLTFDGYDQPLENITFKIKNKGYTIQVDVIPDNDGSPPSVSGGGFGFKYILAQFHMHWGSGNLRGSEHLRGLETFAAEVHFVHIKEGLTLDEALEEDDGVVVLGILIQIGSEDNEEYDNFLGTIEDVIEYGDSADIDVFALDKLLPDTSKFYRYEGSLTTPPCSEAVIWTLFDDVVKLSADQMNQLRAANATDNDGKQMDNFRPIWPIGSNRKVTQNYLKGASGKGASGQGHLVVTSLLVPWLLLIACLLK